MPAQSKLKDTISQLNRELQHLEVLENRRMIFDVDKKKKQSSKFRRSTLEAIVQIVSSDRQADERWCSELIQFHNSEEGKQHVKTVPVKLLKSQNSAGRSYNNTYFCTTLIRNIKEIVSLLDFKNALVISQDDKA
ncbi:14108_t:CDS:2 [Dentiscutata heterogama]|uniref:14108_t:CDS:1 n=1 Tax=Dentiscutata heterogama TaxID=1316150 RepID=A0ACA9MRV1_9GLOM|nr:14108_t:CDS:2 [Dentiscutata heterogama]